MNHKKVYCELNCWVNRLNKFKDQLQFECFPSEEPDCDINPASMLVKTSIKNEYPWPWAEKGFSEKCRAIKKIIGTSSSHDIKHLDWAYQFKFDYFLTCDKDILKHRKELEDLLAIKLFNPKEEIILIEIEFYNINIKTAIQQGKRH